MSQQIDPIVIPISADISQFKTDMNAIKQTYSDTQKEIKDSKVPMRGSDESTNESFNYAISQFSSIERILNNLSNIIKEKTSFDEHERSL